MAFADEFDTAVAWSFGLEVDGVQIRQIQEVSGLKMSTGVVDLKHNLADGTYNFKRLPGPPEGGEITLTRGLTDDTTFEDWIKAVNGDFQSKGAKMGEARKDGSFIVFDHEGNEIKRYVVSKMWVKTLEIGTMKAGDTTLLTEKVTVTHEGVKPG